MTKLKFRKGTLPSEQASVLRFSEDLEAARTPLGCNYSSFGARKVGETSDGLVLQFIAVSEGIKRDGSTIEVKGIDLAGIQSNPVFMFGHNYSQPPIGRIIGFRKSTVPNLGKVLKVDVAQLRSQMDTEHKRFSDSIFDMYVQGDLRTVSFGWRTIEADPLKDENGFHTGWNFKRTDAMEVSAVPIPADKDALITNIQQRGLDPALFVLTRGEGKSVYEIRESIPDQFEFVAGEETDVEDIELEVRAADPIVPETTETVTAENTTASTSTFEITTIERATPAELQTFMEDVVGALESIQERFTAIEARLDAIDAEEIADSNEDLCVECPPPDSGMMQAQICIHRIGASLNAANRKALTDAVTLISAVLKNAGEPAAASGGTSAAVPENPPVPQVAEQTREPEVSFEDIEDIRQAMQTRRTLSAAEDILAAMALKSKVKPTI